MAFMACCWELIAMRSSFASQPASACRQRLKSNATVADTETDKVVGDAELMSLSPQPGM